MSRANDCILIVVTALRHVGSKCRFRIKRLCHDRNPLSVCSRAASLDIYGPDCYLSYADSRPDIDIHEHAPRGEEKYIIKFPST